MKNNIILNANKSIKSYVNDEMQTYIYIVTRRTNVSTIVYFCALYFKISCVHKVRTKKKERKKIEEFLL